MLRQISQHYCALYHYAYHGDQLYSRECLSLSLALLPAVPLNWKNEDQYSVIIIYYSLSKNLPKHSP